MNATELPSWLWIPIVIGAAAAQTARNAAQRALTQQVGTLAATLVRFLYGLPFSLLWLALAWWLAGDAAKPTLNLGFALWLTFGALAQLGATALLLAAMQQRNFIVAVAFSKTEVVQVALFAVWFLGEVPGWLTTLGIALATGGVVLLSWPKSAIASKTIANNGVSTAETAQKSAQTAPSGWRAALSSPLALLGLGSGALFALASVGYRGAALAEPGVSPWLLGGWGVFCAQLLQTVLLGGWLLARNPQSVRATASAWRLSLSAGTMGALASIGWFTSGALHAVADVRTLGLVEVLFSYAVSHRLLGERLSAQERWGLGLVLLGVAAVCWRW